ncbi:MAG: glycosyltransferase family 39 protein [Pirellulales bacterium]|nr:glycosyltransferase family 39 protein [Pirellulales bacterium]
METPLSRRQILIAAIAVFVVAVALRMPSCYQSFWVDELHSAWVVWGDFDDVLGRAQRGHQTPLYFWGLWVWKTMAGESELALRMSSVLAVALGGTALVVGVGYWTRSVIAGLTAGLVVAVESNGLFFGTELRPYAGVIFFTCLVMPLFFRLIGISARQQRPVAWFALITTITLAVLCQPTAAGVLVGIPISLLAVWYRRNRKQLLRLSLLDCVLMWLGVAVGFWIWSLTLAESWQQRSSWESFATAKRLAQLWRIWDWPWLLLFPFGLLAVSRWLARIRGLKNTPLGGQTVVIATIVVLATAAYWAAARWQWVPLWHRRYFIAALPMLACVVGGSLGAWINALRPGWERSLGGPLAAIFLIIGLANHQGVLRRLPDYPVALARRGENWRDAVGWVRRHADRTEPVMLDSRLIEVAEMDDRYPVELPAEQLEYLLFPLSGPYQLDQAVHLGRWAALPGGSSPANASWILRHRLDPHRLPPNAELIQFGNVSVVRLGNDLERQ